MSNLTAAEKEQIQYYRNLKRRKPEKIQIPGEGQESVWDYPRPPAIKLDEREIRIEVGGILVACSRNALRVLETASPPVYYLPPGDIQMELLSRNKAHSLCEWKGRAGYWDLRVSDRRIESAAWSYDSPLDGYEALQGYLAFYAAKMDRCLVGELNVEPQPGDFYGGWITVDIVGPFKGERGTLAW